MKVVPVPCLKDNYAYLIICEKSASAAVVDPSEAEPVIEALQGLDVDLVAILNTHHHWDHVGGNEILCDRFPQLRVYGHATDSGRIARQSEFLEASSSIEIGRLHGSITHNPGHTRGAITYYFEDAAFTGDTLFGAGCGRIFEGTPAEMYASLHHQIGSHPHSTKLYFGHEYTENNLRFALHLEPGNAEIQARLTHVQQLRAQASPTCPSTLADEFATNPFMRCTNPNLIAAAKAAEPNCDGSPSAVFAVLRRLKDRF